MTIRRIAERVGRSIAAKQATATVQVVRRGNQTTDPDTGVVSRSETLVWEGAAVVRANVNADEKQVADVVVDLHAYRVQVPPTVDLRPGDLVRVVADAYRDDLPDVELVVDDVADGSPGWTTAGAHRER